MYIPESTVLVHIITLVTSLCPCSLSPNLLSNYYKLVPPKKENIKKITQLQKSYTYNFVKHISNPHQPDSERKPDLAIS
jgi:hypothetical protein